jgi:hypothetical protein
MRTASIFRLAVCAIVTTSAVAAQQPQAPTDPSAVLGMQQNQTAQFAATWLHSGDPRLQAWGAYVILRDHHEFLVPDLVTLARDYEATPWPVAAGRGDQHDAMIAILDTLIQLYGGLGPSDAARLYPEFPAQSLILLSRSGKSANGFLLDIFRKEKLQRLEWLTAGNLLAADRVPGFAEAVLGKMTVHIRARVVTFDIPDVGHGEGGSCGGGAEGKSDWPTVGNYALAQKGTGATLLADGDDPTYYRRTVSGLYDQMRDNCCGSCIADPLLMDLYREHYLARMLFVPLNHPPVRASFDKNIVWKDGETFLASLRTIVRQQKSALADVATKLTKANLMTAEEEASVKPQIEITIVDDRESKRSKLPRVENLGENVIVKI